MSDKKRIDLHNLIETHKPNIIIGTESHLDSTIASSEIFPDNFQNPYRKDRKLGEGGDNNYITTETITKEDFEINWCKINIAGNQPLHIGAFYRQPNSGSEKIEELEKFINPIVEGSKGNLPNIILGGDFNLPHIDWGLDIAKPNPQYGKEISKKLTDIVNENNLTQVVREPTRGNNILDLMFTTNPGLISSVEVHPDMSDHNAIITDVNKGNNKITEHRAIFQRERQNS